MTKLRGKPIIKRINGTDCLTLLSKHSGKEILESFSFDEIMIIIDLFECGRTKELNEYYKKINCKSK